MKTIYTHEGQKVYVDKDDYDKYGYLKWYWNGRYVYRKIAGNKTVYLHVLIIPHSIGELTDHKNGKTYDCRKNNLRVATKSLNAANSKTLRSNNTSGYKGIWFDRYKSKWVAATQCNGIRYFMGIHTSKEGAALAYNKKAKELFGEFAKLNEVKP